MKKISKGEQKIIDLQLPAGRCLIVEDSSSGLLHQMYWSEDDFLADRFKRKIKSETAWFESVITHAPAIGSFYENLIRSTIKEYAPTNNKVGTGFVFDSSRNKHGKQIDVLVYDDSDRSAVYRSDEFVVVNPGSVISTVEVKKTLNATVLKDAVRSSFYSNLGTENSRYQNIQKFRIFSFSLTCRKETITKALVEVLEECIGSLKVNGCDGKSGFIPITYCSLPELYFLDEDFYVTTKLVVTERKSFRLQVCVEKAPGNQSIGRLLDSVVRENPSKISLHEKSYLARPIKPLSDKIDVSGELYLVDINSIYEIASHYPGGLEFFRGLVVNDAKPISIYTPKGVLCRDYKSLKEFMLESGSRVEFFKVDGSFMMSSKAISIGS